MNRVREIENALADALKYRIGVLCDIVLDVNGDRQVRIFDPERVSEGGGWEIAAKFSLTGLAVDLERALS